MNLLFYSTGAPLREMTHFFAFLAFLSSSISNLQNLPASPITTLRPQRALRETDLFSLSAVFGQDADDAFGGVAVPQRWALTHSPLPLQNFVSLGHDLLRIIVNQHVSPLRQRDGPLCRVSEGNARDIENGRLFLDTARVGENNLRMGHEVQEIKVAKRLKTVDLPLEGFSLKIVFRLYVRRRMDLKRTFHAEGFDLLCGPRVDGKENREMGAHFQQSTDNPVQRLHVIHIGRAMKRHKGVRDYGGRKSEVRGQSVGV